VTTVEYKDNCGLCGVSVEIKGFSLTSEKGIQSFCCAGCLSIYQLLYMNNRVMDHGNDDKNTANKEDN
jgi:hypothetical protein